MSDSTIRFFAIGILSLLLSFLFLTLIVNISTLVYCAILSTDYLGIVIILFMGLIISTFGLIASFIKCSKNFNDSAK